MIIGELWVRAARSGSAVPLISVSGPPPSLQPALQLRRGTRRGGGVVDRRGVFALHPVSVAVRLEELYEGFHGDFNHVFTTGALEETQPRT